MTFQITTFHSSFKTLSVGPTYNLGHKLLGHLPFRALKLKTFNYDPDVLEKRCIEASVIDAPPPSNIERKWSYSED